MSSRFSGLTPLLAPRSVAVLGASSDPTRISGRPIAYMRSQGFQGALYPINPKPRRDAGPEGLRLDRRPAGDAGRRDRRRRRRSRRPRRRGTRQDAACKAIVMFTAGFAEMDEAGEVAQAKMVATARSYGMRLLGPNCLGVFDARRSYYATFSSSFDSGWPVPGRIGIASQSGAYGTHLYTLARNRGIGASLCVMTGNEADVTVGECIGWLAENPEVDVIAVYAEGIREVAGPDRRAGSGPRGEEADRDAEGRPQRTRHQGGEIAHRLDRRRRRGHRGGDGRVRRLPRPQFRGDARHRAYRDPEDLSGAQYSGRDHRVRRRRRADLRRGRKSRACRCRKCRRTRRRGLRDLVPFCAPRNPVDATAQVSNDVTLVKTFTESMVRDGGYSSVLGFFSMTASSRRWPSIREQLNAVKTENPDRLYVAFGHRAAGRTRRTGGRWLGRA